MGQKQYRYDPETLSYTAVKHGAKYFVGRVLIQCAYGIVIGALFFALYIYLIDSPKEKELKRENQELLSQYEIMNKRLDQIDIVLADMHMRDENIYRVIYEADSIPTSIRMAGFGGVNRYESLEQMSNSEMVINTAKRLDIAAKRLYVQSVSFDEIVSLAKNNKEMIGCMPSIMPINNRDLKRTASGWGWRIHPIYKIKKFHEGMDFSAPTGTEVYATGDGVVSSVTSSFSGYGKHVKIDHGFGYISLYAHMSEFKCKVGQKVKRGDVIGLVGSTGTSTAPHLHYEVLKKGLKVNPQFYYYQEGLTAEEYERMIEISSNSNQTFD
ncbi:MAG: peptidoglycan DD-metalloendopeptidase family protein [Marinilabiliaceae bacterium]|nr:peptidoglycan DD-metalloendopeptidase family protein [Marinilabiliaceae bacterium]